MIANEILQIRCIQVKLQCISYFVCLYTPLDRFLAPFSVGVEEIISPLNFINFSTSDRMDETIFGTQNFGGLVFLHLRLLIYVRLRPPKGTPVDYVLSISVTGLHENFLSLGFV